MSFRALLTEKAEDGTVSSAVQILEDARLPEGDVTVDIEWAGLNYKDGLCLTGQGGLVRTYPHVAGVDFAGTVRESDDSRYRVGDKVVLTGWRVGEAYWGGYSERARVKADWLVPLPNGLSARDAMIMGTAGLTAMLAINRLEWAGLSPSKGDVLVTGAAGGVGSISVALLRRLGYSVTALSGRPQHADMLRDLGAANIINRNEFMEQPDKPLESARFAAAIDCVGGAVLGKLLRQIAYGGSVASLGNAAGIKLDTNVLPFLLRGVNLLGIDSVMQPFDARTEAWARLADLFDFAAYAGNVEEVGLDALPEKAAQILSGAIKGRVLINPKG
ncbi:acrylyl-CoA reductase (NADPH) [Devosia subaequoris]|uniref:Acrylyl-CoA reductase (NADPH) n=1 Tax=Devosia subaequoris TaxID=395930 RepID=A0A7W6IJW6_9HYPH|nr:oxidoreductase [Devosia subaequoris]MBB4050963.1 acrylyl-CoA reductase (NADPH) [Devosia subaequoris]MCP1208368.1 oxidoreductase [Devosia subaequoris]